ncbi:MAG TPA: glycosyltransferase, partial [Gemmatimonadales bacterium]|nr:glycosyltransferase [Gemmatimonadales bacterium]
YGVPVIYDMQSSLPEQLGKHRAARGRWAQWLLRTIEAWLLRRVDTVVSSAGLLQRVAALAPATPAREWHFPIDPAAPSIGGAAARRRELGIAPEASVVLYTGTFEPYQGLPLLLDAVPKVVAQVPGAVFVLVGGEGEGADSVRRDAVRRGLNGSVRLLGRRPREEMPDFLAMADVLVSPRSYGGNLPLKVFDYLAAGRPIVATDVPSHRAMLDESRAVLAAPTPDALASAIVALLGDPERAEGIARSGQAFADRHLGWHRFVQAVHAVYHGVAQRAGARVLA